MARAAPEETPAKHNTKRSWDRPHEQPVAEIRDYTDLLAWQTARATVRRVYETTRGFPAGERFGLTQQLRRSAVSVPSNIAEGYGRGSLRDYIRFLQMARGSLYEMQTQLILAEDLGFIASDTAQSLTEQTNECARLLQGLINALKKSQSGQP